MKKFTDLQSLRKIAWVIVIIGGLNRGLVGLGVFAYSLFGYGFLGHVIHTLIGIATVYIILYPASKTHTPLRK